MKVAPIDRLLPLLQDVQPSGKNQYKARCPAHDDSTPSLAIGVQKNGTVGLTCFTGCKAEAICDAVGLTLGDLFPASARSPARPRKAAPRAVRRRIPPLADAKVDEAWAAAKKLSRSGFSGRKLSAIYPYRQADGDVWCWRMREDHPDGDKVVRPLHDNGTEWVLAEPRAPRKGKPLYRLPEVLAADGPVVIVEGEKCADALARIGIAGTTSWGGAKAADKADWSPLAGLECLLWPDNDKAGDEYCADVAEKLLELGCAVGVIDTEELGFPGDGYDAADWLQDHPKATAADVWALPAKPATAATAVTVDLICAADIEEKSVDWLFPGWLARGALHILAGDGGTGKTTLSINLAAKVSSGGKWPDGSAAPQGHVIIWSGEDDVARVLVPRLNVAGADLKMVHFAMGTRDRDGARPFDPATDMDALEAQAKRIGGNVALIVIDPIANAVTGDSHKNTDVRRSLGPVVELAAKLQAAVIGISHFSKNMQGRNVSDRVVGSVAFKNLARLVMVTAKGKDGDCRLVRAKSNIGPDGGGFAYRIEVEQRTYDKGRNDVSRVTWGEPLHGFPKDLLDQVENVRTQRDEAADWLYGLLHDRGQMPYSEVAALAKEDAIAEQTLIRAKKELGVVSKRVPKEGGGRGQGIWIWKLPETGREAAKANQQPNQRQKPAAKYSG